MKRLALVFLASCAVEDPELTAIDSELDLGVQLGYEPDAAAIAGSVTRVVDHQTASNGAYVAFNGAGYVRQSFQVPSSTGYHIWARVIAPSTASDSIRFQLDGGPAFEWQLPVAPAWTWVRFGQLIIETGTTHTYRLDTIEPGVRVDRVLFTTGSDFVPVTDTFEAEAGALVYPMRAGTQKIPYTRYAYVPDGYSDGSIELDVDVPYGGTYTIWGRASIPNADARRFLVGRAGNLYYGTSWAPPITSSGGWSWSKTVGGVSLAPGDRLEIYAQENEGKVDKILVTNDAGFRLVESSPPPVSSL